MLVIVATPTLAGLEGFTTGLIDSGAEVVHVRNGMEALAVAKVRVPSLVVVDGNLSDFRPFALVTELVHINAAINTAIMSALDPDQFHQDAEGLGVLAQIAPYPVEKDALDLMSKLIRIL